MSNSHSRTARIFSARIPADAGFNTPQPIPGLPGWTVSKKQQTEIYVITHNLHLKDPAQQMHVVASPMDVNTVLIVQNVEHDSFTISTWTPNVAAKQSAFMFIAAYYG